MGRMLVWVFGLVLVAGLAWGLLGEGAVGSSAPSFDALGGDPDPDGGATGPALKVRDGVRLMADERETGDTSARGIVLDERGLPLAGVKVTARRATPSGRAAPNGRRASAYFDPPVPPGRIVADAVSDAGGLFVIEGLSSERSYFFEAAVAPPRYSSRRRHTVRASTTIIKIVVGEGSALRGRVVDAQGAGLAAWVSATANDRDGLPRWLSRYWSVRSFQTGSDGRFELPAVPSGTLKFSVTVLGRGQRTNIPVDTPAAGEVELRFEDASGAMVTGRVSDTAGRPVGGARIAVASRHVHGGWQRSMAIRATTTDAAGTYTVERLIPGEIAWLTVQAEGYIAPSNLAAYRPLHEERPTQVDVVLSRGALIAGRVTDQAGAPVAGARLSFGRRGRTSPGLSVASSATSDASGQYELTGVPLGQGFVTVRAPGYYLPAEESAPGLPPWMQHQAGGRHYEATEEGERLEMNLVVSPGEPVAGTVTHEDGSALAGATVELRPQNNNRYAGFPGSGNRIVTRSGEDGGFAFPALAPGRSYRVKAWTATHLSEWVKFALPRTEGDGAMTIVVKEGATAAGRASTTEGQAVAGMTVTVSGATTSAVTLADGSYEITGIEAGKRDVRAGIDPRPSSAQKKVDFAWGQRAAGIDLTIPPAASIHGVVTDEQGAPVQGVTVSARLNGNKRGRYRASTTSKGDGSFVFESLREGDYTLYAGPTKHEHAVPAGTKGILLTFIEPTPRRVEGRVEDMDGHPVAAGRVKVWYGKDGKRRSSTNATISAGYFRTRNDVKYDAIDLEVTSAFDASGRALNFLPERVRDVDVSAGDPVVLKLSRGLEIRGRIEDEGGAPIEGILVNAAKKGRNSQYWPGQPGTWSARSGEDGAFRLIGLKEEELTLNASPGGSWVTPEAVAARPGDEVVIRLSRGGVVAGKVLTFDGEPIPGARIWLAETEPSRKSRGVTQPRNHMEQYRYQRTVEADGSFEVKGLPNDALFNVTANVQDKTRAFVSETVRDVTTGTRDLRLQLRQGVTVQGSIEGPDGESVRSAWIQAQPVDSRSGLKGGSGRVNRSSGKFTIGPLQPGRYKITVHVNDKGYSAPAPQEVDAPAEGLRFVCPKALELTGTLLGENVKGFRVYFSASGRSAQGTVGANGSFRVSKAAAGNGILFAHKRGDSRYGMLENVDSQSGPFTLTLQEGLAITGRVEGLPENAKGGNVWGLRDGFWVQGSYKAGGDFELTGLAPGEYQIRGWIAGGQATMEGKVQAGAAGVVLTFKKR